MAAANPAGDRRGLRSKAFRALFDISVAAGARNGGQLADTVAGHLRALFAVDSVALWLWDAASGQLVRLSSSGSPPYFRDRLLAGQGMAGQAFASGQLVVSEDY
ncbi:MAG TPA: hypothetical protein VKU60_14165, partial [Chloroflexota bacterium]|nr:hypothetical protein [Chloroflexota bacterium]